MKKELCDQLYRCPTTSVEILERIIDDTKASDFEENIGGSIKARTTCDAAGKLKKTCLKSTILNQNSKYLLIFRQIVSWNFNWMCSMWLIHAWYLWRSVHCGWNILRCQCICMQRCLNYFEMCEY